MENTEFMAKLRSMTWSALKHISVRCPSIEEQSTCPPMEVVNNLIGNIQASRKNSYLSTDTARGIAVSAIIRECEVFWKSLRSINAMKIYMAPQIYCWGIPRIFNCEVKSPNLFVPSTSEIRMIFTSLGSDANGKVI